MKNKFQVWLLGTQPKKSKKQGLQGHQGKPNSTKPWLAKPGREKRKAKGKKKLLNGPSNYQKVTF
jgi:hypothetical protein